MANSNYFLNDMQALEKLRVKLNEAASDETEMKSKFCGVSSARFFAGRHLSLDETSYRGRSPEEPDGGAGGGLGGDECRLERASLRLGEVAAYDCCRGPVR